MSFYRNILAAVAAIALVSPVFADDTAAPASTETTPAAQTETSAPASTEQKAAATETKVNVNKATAKELMKVKGLNASKARAIVAYRKKNGDFKSLDDLSSVKGFKKMKSERLKEIQDQLTVE